MGLRMRERRVVIFILVATCIPLIILTCHAARASPESGPDIEVPGGYKISDHGGMDVNAQQSTNAMPEGSVQIDEMLSLVGTATGAGIAAARRLMMQKQKDEEEKEKRKKEFKASSAQGSSSTGSSATGFVGGRPSSREPENAMPTFLAAQPIDKSSDGNAFPWHEVSGAYLGSMASLLPGIIEGTKEDYGAWRAYFDDPTSAAPSNIAHYLKQYGSESLGFPVKEINPDAGAAVMTAVDFFGLGKIPFTGNLPRGLILEQLKHGGGWEGLKEGFRYTSLGQVGMLASIALDPSMDEHLRAQCAGQLMAQGSLIAFSMLGSKLIPKVKSELAEALDEIRTGAKAQSLAYVDTEEFIWRQAINEAIQDSKLEEIAQMAEDLGELESYYKSGELSLILRGITLRATEGHNIRIQLPPSLIETIMAEEGPVQVELIDSVTGETYSFYRDFHKVEQPDIDIPFKIMKNFQADQEVIVKMRKLPVWEFANSIEGDASGIIKFNKDGVLVANLGGKEIPIQSLDYDYWGGLGMGGSAYVEFKVEDITGKTKKFRVYDNGLDESRLTVYVEDSFRSVESLKYDPRRDSITVEYRRPNRYSRTTLRFRESPEEIDLYAGMTPEEMIARVKSGNKVEMGKVGEKIAAKFAKEKLKAIVFEKEGSTGPDRNILLDGEHGILEVKLTTYESELETTFVKAIHDVCQRFKQNSEYRQGVAVAVYFDEDTGNFELIYRIATPETQNTAFEGLNVPKNLAGKIKDLGIDLEYPDRLPLIQSFAGYSINQGMSSNAQYSRQQTMFGLGKGSGANRMGRLDESKIIESSTIAQDISNSRSSMNTQDMVGSRQWSMVHSQSKKQGPLNQSSEPTTKVKQQGQDGKINSSDPKKASVDESSKTSKARDDRQQTIFEGRESSGKPMAQQEQQRQQQGNKTTNATSRAASEDNRSMTPRTHNEEPQTKYEDKKVVREDLGQQRQRQGQQAKQQGDKIAKKDAEPSNKNGKSDSQQTLNRGSENAKDSNRPVPSNGSKGDKDQDTKSRAPSHGSRSIPI